MPPSEPMEIKPSDLSGLADALILDVREPFEWEICHLPGSILMPMGQLQARLAELPRDRRIVVMCHHGVRSLNATGYLRQSGFPLAVSLAGGIDRWAREIDTSVNRY